jgi:hypothetical protein
VGRAGDIARDEDIVGHHAVDVEGAATGVAGDAPETGREPGALQPLDIAYRSERRHHDIDVERGPVGEPRTSYVPSRVTLELLDGNAGAQVDAVIPLHLGGDFTDHASECADKRRVGTLGHGYFEVEFAADRGHFRADKAGPDNEDAPRLSSQRRLKPARVVCRANGEQALELRLRLVEPRPRPNAGRDQQTVERHFLAGSQPHGLRLSVQAGGGDAEPPLRIDLAAARQQRMVGAHPPFEYLFRKWGTIVRLLLLVANEGQLPAEPLVAQGFGGAKSGERRADDDDAAGRLERCDQVRRECRRAHDAACFSLSWKSSMIACTGQEAAD